MDDTQNTTLLGRFGAWWSHPFNSQGSAFSWTLFVGLIIIVTFLWQLILIELLKEA